MKKNKLIYFKLLFLLVSYKNSSLVAQNNITLEQCQEMALKNYPLIKQLELLDKSKDYNLDNISKGNYPQFSFIGQATYQSDVTNININLLGMNIPPLSKDQYRFYGEVYQSLTDFKNISEQKELISTNNEIEKNKIEIELFKIKERINQLYFVILLMDIQIEQINLLKKDININLEKININIENGTSTKMNAHILEAEIIKLDQRIYEYEINKKASINVLKIFTKQNITESTKFIIPEYYIVNNDINRPELKLYDLQIKNIGLQSKQLNNRLVPKIGLFFQGGVGRPGLNMLSNDFASYYIA